MDKHDCQEYLRFNSLTGQSKTIDIKRLRGNICNKGPERVTKQRNFITAEER
jgi:hypothetical protein